MIIPIDTLRGQLRKDGYYFRMYKGKQIVQRCPNRKEHVKTAKEQANQERFIAKYRKSKPASDAGLTDEEMPHDMPENKHRKNRIQSGVINIHY